MTTPREPWFPSLGARVILRGSHSRAGESGEIVGSPRRTLNGWTVRLDSGNHVGAGKRQMRPEAADSHVESPPEGCHPFGRHFASVPWFADLQWLDDLVRDRHCYDTLSGTYAIPIESFDALARIAEVAHALVRAEKADDAALLLIETDEDATAALERKRATRKIADRAFATLTDVLAESANSQSAPRP